MMSEIDAQPGAETNELSVSTAADSDDSDGDSRQEDTPVINWNDLSIIERVGLNSVEMSETDLETAFTQISLAFSCDQYTLKQRLQAEEHARNLAEENIQLELTRGRETLETLKGMCLDSKRSTILQRLELSLDILAGTVERISNTAEVLGAVHQEARVSRAVELMVSHVENLRRRHDRHEAELEEAKKTIQQQSSCRSLIDPRASPDPDDSDKMKKSFLQSCNRRRVSISLIPPLAQEKEKRDLKKRSHRESSSKKSFPACPSPTLSSESSCSAMTKDDSYSVDDRPADQVETLSNAAAAQPPPEPPPIPKPEEAKRGAPTKIQHKSATLDVLRQRHKSKAAPSKKKTDKDKKRTNVCRRISGGPHGTQWRPQRPAHWLYRRHWAFLFYIFVLLSVVTLLYILWRLHGGELDL